ncbi:hypothetical protein H0H87_011768 [Tephrocybe sp. NHM501043]|nr:hypothetical protein H0H87_011768 [Tephrocybe sp. NHM501043]
MWAALRCFHRPPPPRLGRNVARAGCRSYSVKHETDECGIPLEPTWSVHDLLSSYPKPTLSSATLTRLHELSALVHPQEGSHEHEKLKREMEELIKLVDAVKLVDTRGVRPTSFELPDEQSPGFDDEPSGQSLLKNAARTKDGFYVVDSDRKRL